MLMKSSMKLAMILTLASVATFAGCSDEADSELDDGGGKGGTSSKGGSAGSSSGGASGGTSGTSGGTGGSSGGTGGSSGGTGGSSGGTGGGSAGTTVGGAGGDAPVEGGAGGQGGSPALCEDDAIGGAGGFGFGGVGGVGAVSTAIVLLDNVQVKDGSTVVEEWQFEDATAISNSTTYTADKWIRQTGWGGADDVIDAATNTFFACGSGDLSNGSMRNVIPFDAADQVYITRIGFAHTDYRATQLTADLKFVAGGCEDGAVLAQLFVVSGISGETAGDPLDITLGEWDTLSVAIPDDANYEEVATIVLRIHTQACNK
jgi:hypothetical protein